jgi:hypothetical protein
MSTESERIQILSMIESGKITPSQGVKLLQALDDAGDNEELAAEDIAPSEPTPPSNRIIQPQDPLTPLDQPLQTPPQNPPVPPGFSDQPVEATMPQADEDTHLPPRPAGAPDFDDWRRWSMVPLWIGVVVTILASVLLYTSWMAARGPGFWFACAWLPFLIGIGMIVLAWGGHTVRWLHIRVQQKAGEWPQTIAISIPLPLRLLAYLVRIFGSRIPGAEGRRPEEMILALQNTSPEAPFYLDVDEGEDGERVQIFIG